MTRHLQVSNGYDMYVNEQRFAAENAALRTGYVFAGISSDMGDSGTQMVLNGKSVLLARDAAGRFHAHDQSKAPLPATERCGILFVVTHPDAGRDYEAEADDILAPELAAELETYQLHRNQLMVRAPRSGCCGRMVSTS